jgi:hypothetical protein
VKLQKALARFRRDEFTRDDGDTIVAIFVLSNFHVFVIDHIPAPFGSRPPSMR